MNKLKTIAIICLTFFCTTSIVLDAVMDIAFSNSGGFSFVTVLTFYSTGITGIINTKHKKEKKNENKNNAK